MIDPDFSKNIPPPEKKSIDVRQGEEKPVGVPQTKKEFKALLRKESDHDDGDEHKGKAAKESTVEDKVAEKTPVKKQRHVDKPKSKDSIFALAGESSKQTQEATTKKVIAQDAGDEEDEDALALKEKLPSEQEVAEKPPTAEQPKTAVFNPYAEKEEKKVSNAPDRPVKGKTGKLKEKEDAPKQAPFLPEKEDVAEFRPKDESKEKVVPLKPKPATPVEVREKPQEQIVEKTPQSIFTPYAFTAPPKEHKVNTQFNQEQPDLAYINPFSMGIQASTGTAPTEGPRSTIAPEMLQLMEQMIDKITTLEHEGKTDTSVTIKNVPLFDGANLKITSFDSARGEFNVSFENLKPEALTILQENTEGLRSSMENKGFTVHIITTTTLEESKPFTAEAQSFTKDSREEGQEQQGQQEEGEEDE